MAKLIRSVIVLGMLASLAGAAGFWAFAETVHKLSPARDPRADAIVVLTGDEERITTGVRLMAEGRAPRLLISGVNPTTRMPTELKRPVDGSDTTRDALVRCCIEIGHAAMNTSGNADEARQWVRSNGFRSLIVVTSSYHMLRSRVEFARVMPDIHLVSHPVSAGRNLQLENWWHHWPTARLLFGEYLKFLGSSARFSVARLVTPVPEPSRPVLPPGSLPSASATPRSDR